LNIHVVALNALPFVCVKIGQIALSAPTRAHRNANGGLMGILKKLFYVFPSISSFKNHYRCFKSLRSHSSGPDRAHRNANGGLMGLFEETLFMSSTSISSFKIMTVVLIR
jgi:hypothetical protein